MVSILDWSRITRGMDLEDKGTSSLKLWYRRDRDEDVMRKAQKNGYFLHATQDLLSRYFVPNAGKDEYGLTLDMPDKSVELLVLQLLNLTRSHLPNTGDIGMCTNLRICVLSHNYISSIEGLASCRSLVMLNVSHNQIKTLPERRFWEGLSELKFLYLHDNPIGRIDYLSHMSAASALLILTVYDTPLALKKNYRHHVVNHISTLLALDNYIVSDEEIIEGAKFKTLFCSFHPALKLNLCPRIRPTSSFKEYLAVLNKLMTTVNKVMARHSPVLIAQKTIRSYLTRCRVRVKRKNKGCAAVTIQRLFRKWKGLSNPPQDANWDAQIRRPSDIHFRQRLRAKQRAIAKLAAQGLMSEPGKDVVIDLEKLNKHTFEALKNDPVMTRPIESPVGGSRRTANHPKLRLVNKLTRIMSTKQFFAPLELPTHDDGDDEDFPFSAYRLRGLKSEITCVDLTTEVIVDRREAGCDVRSADIEYHRRVDNAEKPHFEQKPPSVASTSRQRQIRNRTMAMSCLYAVHAAYKDREKMERQEIRSDNVVLLKEHREFVRRRTKALQEGVRRQVLNKRSVDENRLMLDSEHNKLEKLTYLENSDQYRAKSAQNLRRRRGDLNFEIDFNVQNTSVSNALMRHDRQSAREDQLQECVELVTAHKGVEKDQQQTVNKYLEHRQLMRQAEVAMARAALDTKMLQEANERLIDARSRVEQQKLKIPTSAAEIVASASLNLPSIAKPSQSLVKNSAFALKPIVSS